MRKTYGAVAALCLAGASLVAAGAPASADEGTNVGHCTLVTGTLGYSPGITLLPKQTTMTMDSYGSNCVDVGILDEDGNLLEASSVHVHGTFTGQGSTTLSNYSGSGTATWTLSDGSTRVDSFTATCVAGVLAICPLLGSFTSGPNAGATVEITPTPVNVDLVGPVAQVSFVEAAFGYARML